MKSSLRELNEKRKANYYKDPRLENFLYQMNKALQALEFASYRDYPIQHPFLFIFGLPRSGTTLITQLMAYSLDIGYINNITARFWLAPLHGIRLSKNILGNRKGITFQSEYARTRELADIHEFGYFWRYWLKKESLSDVTHAREREQDIDWNGLKKTLANIQHEFNKPLVFKNIFGSYHIDRLNEILEKVLYIYIERDSLDVAVSILDARKQYYDDLNQWWSYTPMEYDRLKGRDYWEQIAGQVFYLQKFYNQEFKRHQNIVKIFYPDLCATPRATLEKIQIACRQILNYELKIVNPPPDNFPFRTYRNREQEKEKFKSLLEKFHKADD